MLVTSDCRIGPGSSEQEVIDAIIDVRVLVVIRPSCAIFNEIAIVAPFPLLELCL